MPVDARSAYALPEQSRNDLLRGLDWRFLIAGEEEPAAGDLIEIGFPTRRALRRARASLGPAGVVVCRWRLPRLFGARRARAKLEAAGFTAASVHWPGPIPWRSPQFWLPLGSVTASRHLLATRPGGASNGVLKSVWRLIARLGLLGPLVAIARAPGGDTGADPVSLALPTANAITLLTGGHRSINKVVGFGFGGADQTPTAVLKAARVPEAVAGLEREAEALEALARERPGLRAVPRLLARGSRAGMRAIVEAPLEGRSLLEDLSSRSFPAIASEVTSLAIELAGEGLPVDAAEWRSRLVDEPLAALERGFGSVMADGEIERARRTLGELGALPVVCEHRDCSPWNIVRTRDGGLGLHDWESAELHGLPAIDLIYFLANAAFVVDGALESASTAASYRDLLDPSSANGRVASACTEEYLRALGIATAELGRLRLLCWVIHCRSDLQHLELETAGAPDPQRLRQSPHLGLIRVELEKLAQA